MLNLTKKLLFNQDLEAASGAMEEVSAVAGDLVKINRIDWFTSPIQYKSDVEFYFIFKEDLVADTAADLVAEDLVI